MSTLLYSLGRWSYRHPWRVLVGWLLLLAVVGGSVGVGMATGGIKGFDNSFSIPGTEGEEGLKILNRTFPQASGTSAQFVIVAAPGDSIDDEPYRGEIGTAVSSLGTLDGVLAVTDPFGDTVSGMVSEDGQAALIRLQFEGTVTDVRPRPRPPSKTNRRRCGRPCPKDRRSRSAATCSRRRCPRSRSSR